MGKIVYDVALMQTISLFEQMSGAQVKDCIAGDPIIFVVNEGEIGKAIGKGGQNVRRLEDKLKKKVKIVEFSPVLLKFIKNLVAPCSLADIVEDNGVVTMMAKDLKTRGLLIGRSASNLRSFEAVIQRYFPIKELKVA